MSDILYFIKFEFYNRSHASMNLLISNYLEKIGGIPLIQNLQSHSLWCSIEAKGILQKWKESYDYENGAFSILVENEGIPIMLTEGDKTSGIRKINQSTQILTSNEVEVIHTTILLVPEILFL